MGLFSILKKLTTQKSNTEATEKINLFDILPDNIEEIRELIREGDAAADEAIRKDNTYYYAGPVAFTWCVLKKLGIDEYQENARRICLNKIYSLGRTRFVERTTDDNAESGEWSTAAFIHDMLELGGEGFGDTAVRNAFYMDFWSVVKQFYDSISAQMIEKGSFSLPEPVSDALDEIDKHLEFWKSFQYLFRKEGRYNPEIRSMITSFYPGVLNEAKWELNWKKNPVELQGYYQFWNTFFEACPKELAKISVRTLQHSSVSVPDEKALVAGIVKKYKDFCSMNTAELGKSRETDLQVYKEAADQGNPYASYLYAKLLNEDSGSSEQLVYSYMEKAAVSIDDARLWLRSYWIDKVHYGSASMQTEAENMQKKAWTLHEELVRKNAADYPEYAAMEL